MLIVDNTLNCYPSNDWYQPWYPVVYPQTVPYLPALYTAPAPIVHVTWTFTQACIDADRIAALEKRIKKLEARKK